MNLNIKKGGIPFQVDLPCSKSYGNRSLIIASIKETPVRISNLPQALDVIFLVKALKQIGLQISQDEKEIIIHNSFPLCELPTAAPKVIEVGEGGTTARFLACLLLKGSHPYILKLGSRLKERPWDEFIEMSRALGARCELNDDELFIQGPIQQLGELKVDCSRTTQFATGMALVFSPQMKIIPQQLVTSPSYWQMTCELISTIHQHHEYQVPLDWSSASYSLAFAALNQETFFPALFNDPLQADAKFYLLLKRLGCLIQENDGVRIKPKKIKEDISINVSDCLDLVPTLIYFLSHIEGTHHLSEVKNLIHKESDRLGESLKILDAFNKKFDLAENQLVIYGDSNTLDHPVTIILPDDHRMVMCAALFMRHNSGGELSPRDAVNKSYPEFFELFN